MEYEAVVVSKHNAELLREKVYKLCFFSQTYNDLVPALGLSKGQIKTATDYLEKHSHLTLTKVVNKSTHRKESVFTSTNYPYKATSIDVLQKQHDMKNRAENTGGKYDEIIRQNKNLQIYKLMDRVKPHREGVRKSQKFVGIGSCFAMFDGVQMDDVPTLKQWLKNSQDAERVNKELKILELKKKRREQIKIALRTKSVKQVAYEFDTYYMEVYRIARNK